MDVCTLQDEILVLAAVVNATLQGLNVKPLLHSIRRGGVERTCGLINPGFHPGLLTFNPPRRIGRMYKFMSVFRDFMSGNPLTKRH